MTELEKWLAERRRIHAAASKGPWRVGAEGSEGSRVNPDTGDLRVDSRHILTCNGRVQPEDGHNARSAVDAHNTLPALIAMVEAVLKRHQREMDPFGITRCESCHSHTGEQEEYPCEELRDIEEAVRRG